MNIDTNETSPFAIGVKLKTEFDQILGYSSQLRAVSSDDEDYGRLLKPAEDLLNKALASISFIGQVKAGKTSLVNGLIGKPDFLPSDVNPWTAVVTKLFFGKPGGPNDGAKFSFFDDKQWDKFANRGGRLAELAAEIPESEDKLEVVRAEVERMRGRAKRQLGDKFHVLLGKSHRFQHVNTDVLARYICAGDDPEALVKTNVTGRYADITREASVYFDKEKFAFPSVLVDTPGLNDPLLIREEITLQSLEHSQIFVLVLSAHQAFSSSDLYLLRILNALRLDRLVVFVNRVDELTDPENDVPAIRKHITAFLEEENPGADIPVIFGSAGCANNAIKNTIIQNTERIVSIQAINKDTNFTRSSTKLESPAQQDAWVASGMPLLENALSKMIIEGPGKTWTTSARIDLDNAAKIMLSNAESTIADLKRQLDPTANSSPKPDFDNEQFEKESERLFNVLGHRVETSLNNAWNRIQTGLQTITEDFITVHDKEFAQYLERAKKSSKHEPWSCDTSPLRHDLKQYLLEEFPTIQTMVLQTIDKGTEEISASMVEAGITAAQGLRINTAELAGKSPTTTALSKIVAIDMDSSWWKGWISKFMRNATVRDNVAKMIRAQFRPIQMELVDGMSDQLATSASKSMASYREMLNSLRAILVKDDFQLNVTSVKDIENNIEVLNKRIAVCKGVSASLQQELALAV